MRRGLVFIGIALLLFAAAAVAGYFTAARLAPERLRAEVERRLSAALDADVTLGAARLTFADPLPWMRLEADSGRAVPRRGGGRLEVQRTSAFLDPIALVVGRLDIRSLRLEGAVLTLDAPPEREPPAAAGASTRDPLTRAVRQVENWGMRLRTEPCALPELEATPLRVEWARAGGESTTVLDAARMRSECNRLLGRGRVRVSGALTRAGVALPIEADLESTASGVRLQLHAEPAPVRSWARLAGFAKAPEGTLGGELLLVATPNAPLHVGLSLAGRRVRGAVEGAALDLRVPELKLALDARPGRLELTSLALRDGGLALDVRGAVDLPRADDASVSGELRAERLGLGELRRAIEQLPAAARGPLLQALERAQSGRVESLELSLASTVGGLREILERGPLARPGDLRGELRVRDLDWRTPDAAPNALSGTLRFTGDRIELRDFYGRYRERVLPRLQLTLTGVSNVRSADEIHCVRPAPAPPLPGIDSVWRWIESRRTGPERGRSWQTLKLDLDWISHPLLLCTLEQAVAELDRTDGGFDFTLSRGIWAHAPVSAKGSYRGGDAGSSISVDVQMGAPFEAMSPAPPTQPWGAGRVSINVVRLGSWSTRGATGRAELRGSELRFTDTTLRLDPPGRIEGNLVVQLGDAELPRYRVEAQAGRALDLERVWRAAGGDEPRLSGTLHGAAVVEGRLHDGQGPLYDSHGIASLHGRSGEVQRKIPLLLSLAMVGSTFNPFGSRDRLAYQAIDLVGPVKDGVLTVDTLTLASPGVRMAGSGTMQIVEEKRLRGVIGMFFLPTLSSLIDKLPLLNRVFLGENQALAGAYFEVTGSWSQPNVALIPTETLAEGPAGFLLKDIPDFVAGGVRRIQSVLAPRPPEQARREEGGPS